VKNTGADKQDETTPFPGHQVEMITLFKDDRPTSFAWRVPADRRVPVKTFFSWLKDMYPETLRSVYVPYTRHPEDSQDVLVVDRFDEGISMVIGVPRGDFLVVCPEENSLASKKEAELLETARRAGLRVSDSVFLVLPEEIEVIVKETPLVWTNDSGGKKDLDVPIVVLSTRYWPRGGGWTQISPVLETNEDRPHVRPSARSSIALEHGDDLTELCERYFEAETEDEVKGQVEEWARGRMLRIADVLVAAFREEAKDPGRKKR
jgi:hypothetical protein